MKEVLIIILLFYLYSFLGWLAEVVITYIKLHKFVNRGFLIGPLCPIYGACCVLMTLLLGRYTDRPVALFILCMVLCATLEYITSYIMDKIFKNRWWDYYDYKFNINGRICLEFASLFGIGGLTIFYIFNPPVRYLINLIPNIYLIVFVSILAVITIIDLIVSFKVIITLKNISSSLKYDSTEKITKKVKEILLGKTHNYQRLVHAFPDMKVFNRVTELKQKLINDKLKLKREKNRLKKKTK